MKAWHGSLRRPRAGQSRRDLAWVLLWTALSFALASALQLQEQVAALAQHFEAWQLDELPLVLVALSLGLAWHAWRRRREVTGLLAHNRELAQRLISVQEDERLALARELHDELGQHCTAIRLEATYIQRSREPDKIGAAAARAAASAQLLHQGVRNLLRQLRPAELDALGLVAALQALCDAWQERSDVRCAFSHEGDLSALGGALDITIYRVVQEALSNVMQHARARQVHVVLTSTRQGLALRVQDDGCGFNGLSAARGLGLLGATERAAALDGALEIDSAPGAGTRITMLLPRRQAGTP